MKLANRLRLSAHKLTALFILKLTYVKTFQVLLGFFSVLFFLLFLIYLKIVYGLIFIILFLPLAGASLMKPFDDIIVISRVTGSPHALIKNRKVVSRCFEGDRLNSIQLLKLIKQSMFRFLYECAPNSKRDHITTYTHKVMFRSLGLDRLDFIRDIKEIRPGIIRDKLLFVSFKEIWRMDNTEDLLKKVPYYRFKIDINLLREYVKRNPEIKNL